MLLYLLNVKSGADPGIRIRRGSLCSTSHLALPLPYELMYIVKVFKREEKWDSLLFIHAFIAYQLFIMIRKTKFLGWFWCPSPSARPCVTFIVAKDWHWYDESRKANAVSLKFLRLYFARGLYDRVLTCSFSKINYRSINELHIRILRW